ncbi:hypothetical protein GUITHDRAFT_113481 [Guillardia theta CCMP2712]|uniref:CHAT domain-containing protein n=1 Tax=Guillardia theta (strain CCMP2712) TaxID=905079 RepID=L1IW14_GUITC|nr:hypothetical protein GUITHDRAFT_113481 [Guillardia theta CCMP2712]EKX40453.1 hypothetical protein GUITHDRAFT_113481 [Guillardia theta CCMP2712]|eukprot:XP_005827433.1 hypothetical protein GUITHDRAFT_113481 [Guillardia theta CCMP2712]
MATSSTSRKLSSICICCDHKRAKEDPDDALFSCELPHKVLFFADSEERSGLKVEQERDLIKSEFERGAHKTKNAAFIRFAENVSFDYSFYKNTSQLIREVNDTQPVILHLACHGSEQGDITIGGRSITVEQLVDSLGVIVQNCTKLRLVVLNLCHSSIVARELVKHVDFVIGHEKAVADEEAVAFSKNLYYWMGQNQSLFSNVNISRQSCPGIHLLARVSSHVVTWMGQENILKQEQSFDGPLKKKIKSEPLDSCVAEVATATTITNEKKGSHDDEQAPSMNEKPNESTSSESDASDDSDEPCLSNKLIDQLKQARNTVEITRILQNIENGGIEVILNIIKEHSKSERVQEQGCRALRILAFYWGGAVEIAEKGGIEAIIGAMKTHPTSQAVYEEACGALTSFALLNYHDPIRDIGSIMRAMKEYPTRQEVRELAIFFNPYGDEEFPEEYLVQIGKQGGIDAVINGISAHIEFILGANTALLKDYIETILRGMKAHPKIAFVQEAACQTLHSFDRSYLFDEGEVDEYSSDIMTETALEILDQGGISAIVGAIQAYTTSERSHCHFCQPSCLFDFLRYLDRFEDFAIQFRKEGGIAALVGMIEAPHNEIIENICYACSFLHDLAFNNDENAVKIREEGGIRAVVGAMEGHPASERVQGGACSLLWYLAANSAENAVKIREEGGIRAVVGAMGGHPASERVQANGCEAIGHLAAANSAENAVKIREEGGIRARVS